MFAALPLSREVERPNKKPGILRVKRAHATGVAVQLSGRSLWLLVKRNMTQTSEWLLA